MKTIKVKVNPSSSKIQVSKMADGTVKVNLTASPEDGEANKQLLEVLSDKYKIDLSRIKIKRGRTSQRKIVVIK